MITANTKPNKNMKTQLSIKNLVGRAVSAYNSEQHNDASVRVEFVGPDASAFVIHTSVSGGDNVPWAKKPMTYIWNSLTRFGIKQDFSSEQHCCGNVSAKFVQQ